MTSKRKRQTQRPQFHEAIPMLPSSSSSSSSSAAAAAASSSFFSHEQEQEQEITREDAIRALLHNETLSDVTLRGTDGILVIANRGILASRSPVFGRMLFGSLVETSSSSTRTIVVDIGYVGAVLQAIVNYILMDDLPELVKRNWENENDNDNDDNGAALWDVSSIHFLLALVDAADYLALSKLRYTVEILVRAYMTKNPDAAVHLLAACTECDGSNPPHGAKNLLQELALAFVQRKPQMLLGIHDKSILASIPSWYLNEILKQEKLAMNEQSCFQLLYEWAEPKSNPHEEKRLGRRKRLAAKLTSNIELANIDPTILSTIVATSGLVTHDQLATAYHVQALRSLQRRRTSYQQWRGGHVWTVSQTNSVTSDANRPLCYTTDHLQCPILKSGVHKWSIQILQGDRHSLGIVSTRYTKMSSDIPLHTRKGGWALLKGQSSHAKGHDNHIWGRELPSDFLPGSIVSFTLYLYGKGILTASIDDKDPFEVFSGLLHRDDTIPTSDNEDVVEEKGAEEEDGFVPAVSAWGGTVKFLGFEE
jgi:hypothetical protein